MGVYLGDMADLTAKKADLTQLLDVDTALPGNSFAVYIGTSTRMASIPAKATVVTGVVMLADPHNPKLLHFDGKWGSRQQIVQKQALGLNT